MTVLFDLARTVAAVALGWVALTDGSMLLGAALAVFVVIGLALRMWPGWWKDPA